MVYLDIFFFFPSSVVSCQAAASIITAGKTTANA